MVRSQLALKELVYVAKLIKNARLYVLQSFVPNKTLDSTFLSETSYSSEEFSTIRENLEKELPHIVFH